ncbi:MAG: transposase [Verrucomicrobiota bacterium]
MDRLAQPTHVPSKPAFIGVEDEDCWNPPGYARALPHWRLIGATYFITFRQADSLPEKVLKGWEQETSAWLWGHGIDDRWKKSEPGRFHAAYLALPRELREARRREEAKRFLHELDLCHGSCRLQKAEAQDIVSEALTHFHGQRLWVGDWVVMPNHVHVIAQPFEGVKIEEWLYSIKRYSASSLHKVGLIQKTDFRAGHFWQKESFDRVVRDLAELSRTRKYIADNGKKLRASTFRHQACFWLDEFASLDVPPHSNGVEGR